MRSKTYETNGNGLDLKLLIISHLWHVSFSMRSGCPKGAPFIKNQEPHALTTYSKDLLFQFFFLSKIKQYTYNFNDKNTSDDMYT
jgi:hypothetical protein